MVAQRNFNALNCFTPQEFAKILININKIGYFLNSNSAKNNIYKYLGAKS